jgi:MerR family regulatory protein
MEFAAEYNMDTEEIEVLKRIIRETVAQTITETTLDRSLFPLWSTRDVARLCQVSVYTVRDWHRKGLLPARYHRLSGRCVRLVFTNRSLVEFLYRFFPDFSQPHDPRSSHSARMQSMVNFQSLYHRRRLPK